MVQQQGKELRGTNYRLNEHFPQEIYERSKKLIPVRKMKMTEGKKAVIIADKLYIDSRLYWDKDVTPWLSLPKNCHCYFCLYLFVSSLVIVACHMLFFHFLWHCLLYYVNVTICGSRLCGVKRWTQVQTRKTKLDFNKGWAVYWRLIKQYKIKGDTKQ